MPSQNSKLISLGRSFSRSALLPAALTIFSASITVWAGPITTVPWNGHTGAASFTYDDARTSQVPNLLPQLKELNLKATFFISVTGTGGDFEAKKSNWIQAAKDGHELGNHTKNHANLPAEPQSTQVIKEMADYLRALDASVESVTFAYPNCNIQESGKVGVNKEDFLARGCGQTSYAWNKEPTDWMNVQGLILTPSNVNTAVSLLNTAKSSNSWVTTIVHDVKESPDQYSLTPADNKKMLQAGIDNKLWIETFQNVGAYYRAHFTLDTVKAVTVQDGWTLKWKSPHAKLPAKVMMRVKLDETVFGNPFTVLQEGTILTKESDGSYLIDFMKLSLDVSKKTTALGNPAPLPEKISVRSLSGNWVIQGVTGELQVAVFDLQGQVLFRGKVANGKIPVAHLPSRGVALIQLTQPFTGKSMQGMIQVIR
jgi:peptidoglycan/xylan/chitin deacetylase (PgdA/CDA1 family)